MVVEVVCGGVMAAVTCVYHDPHGLLGVADGAASQQQVVLVQPIPSPIAMSTVPDSPEITALLVLVRPPQHLGSSI